MKAQELRIGNWVHHNDLISASEYEGDFRWDICHFYDLERHHLNIQSIQPIPLTEEWLLKFGFEYFSKQIGETKLIYEDYRLNNFVVIIKPNFSEVEYAPMPTFDIEDRIHIHPNIQHVHQLQNLYFALTGEELTVKELAVK